MNNMDNLLMLVENNRIDYNRIFSNVMFIDKTSNKKRDINVFIPVKGRHFFLNPCIRFLKRSLKRNFKKVEITIIENDIYPSLLDRCKKLKVGYIFIPTALSMSKDVIAKSLCYNIGYIVSPKATWNIFHDIDILVDSDYFFKIDEYLKNYPFWIQPYTKRRVIRLGMLSTFKIINEYNSTIDLSELDSREASPGSTGGSIIVRNDVFEGVGGYDPELFWGYAPEDNFFWEKLITYSKSDKNFMDPSVSSFEEANIVYANDPPIEVYHMDHPSMVDKNQDYDAMESVYRFFKTQPRLEKNRLIKEKEQIFKKLVPEKTVYKGRLFGGFNITVTKDTRKHRDNVNA